MSLEEIIWNNSFFIIHIIFTFISKSLYLRNFCRWVFFIILSIKVPFLYFVCLFVAFFSPLVFLHLILIYSIVLFSSNKEIWLCFYLRGATGVWLEEKSDIISPIWTVEEAMGNFFLVVHLIIFHLSPSYVQHFWNYSWKREPLLHNDFSC